MNMKLKLFFVYLVCWLLPLQCGRSRSRERTSRGGRETISGIRRLRKSKSRSRSRSRSPRKRRRMERELRNSSAPSKSKPESKSSSRVSPPKEVLKEVNLFNDDEHLKSCRDSKPKRISRVQSKNSRLSSNSKSTHQMAVWCVKFLTTWWDVIL